MIKSGIVICPALAALLLFVLAACNSSNGEADLNKQTGEMVSCTSGLPERYAGHSANGMKKINPLPAKEGMVLIPAGSYLMGSANGEGRRDEYPQHKVEIDSFWIDATEVTNAQFREFVRATHYVTTAERKPDWEELKKQLPAGTIKPPEDQLVAASLVFTPSPGPVSLENAAQWWNWQKGASWKHPQGPGSSIEGKDNYPAVQVSWEDANAYAKWAGKRLPTEAEWEWAARGGLSNQVYSWGNEGVDEGKPKANTWQGHFPDYNSKSDCYVRAAPVKTFAPNRYGLYEMAGNVWEWCSDWYRFDYYPQCAGKALINPTGPEDSFDPDEPFTPKRVVRGGSFLCQSSYCTGYRVSARMKTSPDTGLENTGFRCVRSAKRLKSL